MHRPPRRLLPNEITRGGQRDDGTGEPAIFIELTLSEPTEPTWPSEDTQALRRRVRELVTGELPGLMFYTQFRVGESALA